MEFCTHSEELLNPPNLEKQGASGGPPVTKVGGMVMYSVKELERFMEERTTRRQ